MIDKKLKICHFDKIGSTNDYAIDLILKNTLDSDIAVLADEQTSGRGRLNTRSWESPKGNFYCSYVIDLEKLKISQQKTNSLTFVAIKSLQEFINNLTNSNVINLKLPNDLLIKNKKLAGVLVEVYYPYAVLGIGLNLISSPIEKATNIKDEFNILVKSDEIVENLYETLIVSIKECCYL